MAIDKSAVRVGGVNGIDPLTNLPMFRKYITFEANREMEFIQVFYIEWVESNGIKLSEKTKSYFVVDQKEVSHIIEGDPNSDPPTSDQKIIDTPEYPMFTGWFEKLITQDFVGLKLGADIIVGSINDTLEGMDFDVPDMHKVTPN